MKVKTKGLLTVLFAYSCAIILGFISLSFSMTLSNMLQILIADIVATFTIYFSVFGTKIHLFMILIGQLFHQ